MTKRTYVMRGGRLVEKPPADSRLLIEPLAFNSEPLGPALTALLNRHVDALMGMQDRPWFRIDSPDGQQYI